MTLVLARWVYTTIVLTKNHKCFLSKKSKEIASMVLAIKWKMLMLTGHGQKRKIIFIIFIFLKKRKKNQRSTSFTLEVRGCRLISLHNIDKESIGLCFNFCDFSCIAQ